MGGRSRTAKAAQAVVTVEVRGQGSGRIRLHVIPDASGETLNNFVHATVAPVPPRGLRRGRRAWTRRGVNGHPGAGRPRTCARRLERTP
ncbi:hypothetical protein [Arthrobacter dokdonensis]|uniref:hypothetical protein n=1 Tax=Arthrobacter dokdonellae TaxID=2211210 RepID=UPI003AB01E02